MNIFRAQLDNYRMAKLANVRARLDAMLALAVATKHEAEAVRIRDKAFDLSGEMIELERKLGIRYFCSDVKEI